MAFFELDLLLRHYLFITYRRVAPQGNPNILMEIDIGPHTYLLLERDLISDSLGGQSLFSNPASNSWALFSLLSAGIADMYYLAGT